jgi:hypothetical protein
MQYQFSQDYDVDSRYRGLKNAVDNAPGKAFAKSYISRGATLVKLILPHNDKRTIDSW